MTQAEPALIHAAIDDLSSDDEAKRTKARAALERFGDSAVWPLIEAFAPHQDAAKRREVVRVLGAIADPAAADVLLAALEDEHPDCRWFAAEGLVRLGRTGLLRILGELTAYPETDHKLRGAHHVLSGLRYAGFSEVVGPVLRAYLSDIPQIELPKAAREALAKVEG